MARYKQAQAEQQQAPQGKNKGMAFLWTAVILVLVSMVALPMVMLILIGMLPTIVAYIIDRNPQKNAAFCVGGMNLIGVFPYIIDLWSDISFALATNILTDVFAWAVMYGAAGFGWMLYSSLPPVIANILTAISQRRIAQLRAKQRRLIEEWGEDIATDSEKN